MLLLLSTSFGCGVPPEASAPLPTLGTSNPDRSSPPYADGPSRTELMDRYRRQKAKALDEPAVWEINDWTDRSGGEEFPRWGPDRQWIYAGKWITHPPLEFAVDLVGEEAVQECVDRFRDEEEAWSCSMAVNDCFTLQLFAQGNVQLTMHPAGNCGATPELESIKHNKFMTAEDIKMFDEMSAERDREAGQ